MIKGEFLFLCVTKEDVHTALKVSLFFFRLFFISMAKRVQKSIKRSHVDLEPPESEGMSRFIVLYIRGQ